MSRGSSGTRARGGRTRPPEGSNQVPKKGKEHRSGSGEVDACARAFGKRPVCYLLWGLDWTIRENQGRWLGGVAAVAAGGSSTR